jgi:hypothetical protein
MDDSTIKYLTAMCSLLTVCLTLTKAVIEMFASRKTASGHGVFKTANV